MYVIRLLLDIGYSMKAVRSFFGEYDAGDRGLAIQKLTEPGRPQGISAFFWGGCAGTVYR